MSKCAGLAWRRILSWLVAWWLTVAVSPAFAESVLSSEQMLEAERLGEQGVGAYQAGEFDKALESLEDGYRLSQWGTIGVWLAKTREKLNQFPEAYRVYADVAASPVTNAEAAPFTQARDEAKAALRRLEASLAVLEVTSERPLVALDVTVNGEDRKLSKAGTLAVMPGESQIEVRWEGGLVPSRVYTLAAGQRETLRVGGQAPPQNPTKPSATGAEAPTFQSLDFSMIQLEGWTLHDDAGNPICELPCKWSGTDPESLTVRRGESKLPVRMGRKYSERPDVLVAVNPARGSKGWALGLGIPSGVLFLGSLVALGDPSNDYPVVAASGAVVFGAGLGLCTWWFLWSKSRPYLSYETPTAATAPPKASVSLDIYGNGLGLKGTF